VDIADPMALRQAAATALQNGDPSAAQELARRALDIEKTQAGITRDVAAASASTAAAQASLSGKTPEPIQVANLRAGLVGAIRTLKSQEQTPEVQQSLQFYQDRLDALPTLKQQPTQVVGVAEGTKAPVYEDDKGQFTYVKGPDGKQTRQPYYGAVNRSTSNVSVNTNMPPQEKAEQSGRGTLLVDQYKDISKQAGVARRTIPALESIANILDAGFDTGFGAETIAAGARILGALGVEGAQNLATSAQSFLGAASSAVLTKQLEQKGPQTESDAQRITQTGAQLGNTKEANRFLITVAKAQLQRDIAQRNFYDSWWKKNKTYDGAEDAWETGEGSRSLFDYPELRKYRATPSAASQIPTSQGTPATPTYARNPQTGQRIMSTDGGKTWQPAR
jgi:hypothetical protein